MTIIDGKKIKEEILEELKEEVSKLDVKPTLVVIQVGNDDASNVYIRQKEKMANYIGYNYRHIKLAEEINTDELLKIINDLPVPQFMKAYQESSSKLTRKDPNI